MSQQAPVSARPQLPQEAYQYAGMYYLGQPLAAYRVAYRQSITLGIICLLLGALFGAVAISNETSGTSILFMVVLMLLCVAGVLYYLALYPLRYSSWRMYSCADGFIFLKGMPFRVAGIRSPLSGSALYATIATASIPALPISTRCSVAMVLRSS